METAFEECPNCACGRIYALVSSCDCCGWAKGDSLRDWSYRRRNPAQAIEARSGETERLDPKGESAVLQDAPEGNGHA